jgi:CBS domain-containing protein
MKVKDIMTRNPAVCHPDTGLKEVAQMMVDFDCGAIPVIHDEVDSRPIGIITDRDIVCRVIARGQDPFSVAVQECMTSPVETVSMETELEDALRLMESRKIRRMVVVDEKGSCCGILAQADVAQYAPQRETATVVKNVSRSLQKGMSADRP